MLNWILRPGIVAAACALFSGCGGSCDGDCDDDGSAGIPVVGGVEYVGSVTLEGRDHGYSIYVPTQVLQDNNVPMVINLHGGGASPAAHDAFTRMRVSARENGFAVLSPQGYGRTWNAGDCCPPATTDNIDHVQIVRDMVEEAARTFGLDRGRVYATGFSNGAMLAYRLACEAADLIVAIAPVAGYLVNRDLDGSGAEFFACNPSRAVPVLHLHGRADSCAPFDGGFSTGPTRATRPAVVDSVDTFRLANSCDNTFTTEAIGSGARCTSWPDCARGATVELCSIDEAGHVWPGTNANPNRAICGGQGTDLISANDRTWRFFSRFRL